jgi:hypothetical protein
LITRTISAPLLIRLANLSEGPVDRPTPMY